MEAKPNNPISGSSEPVAGSELPPPAGLFADVP
jgi:hypothetical protein